MNTANYSPAKPHKKVNRRFKKIGLVALPVVAIALIAIPFFRHNSLNSPYSYPFEPSAPGNNTLRLEKEIAFYQKKIAQDPESALNQASLAGTYLKMARATGEASWYLLAESTAQQSLAKMPFDNEAAVISLARVNLARHDFRQALKLIKPISKSENTLPLLVTAHLALGELDEAQKAANALVNRIPSLGSLTLKGLVEVSRGEDEAALKDLQQAIALEEPEEAGSSVWARTLLGRLYYKQGKLKEAESLYQESLRILPTYPPALLNLAQLEIRQGRYSEAEKLYSQIYLTLQKSPTVYDHVVLRGMARVKDLQGKTEEAKALRNQAETRLREDLTGFGHQRELAQLLLERGNPKDISEAVSLMQTELKNRQDAETLDTWAEVLASAKRWQEAERAIQTAIKSGVKDPAIFQRAATISQALGKEAVAANYLAKVKQTDPTFNLPAEQASGLGVGLSVLN
jgi:tetratricopeptide (TPR) repeat protein